MPTETKKQYYRQTVRLQRCSCLGGYYGSLQAVTWNTKPWHCPCYRLWPHTYSWQQTMTNLLSDFERFSTKHPLKAGISDWIPPSSSNPTLEQYISLTKTSLSTLPMPPQACKQGGGFEGGRSDPLFGLQKILYAPLNCTFWVPYYLKLVQ